MVGQSGIGTYVAYAFIWAFLLLLVVIFARVVLTVSMLWLMPVAALLRRLRLVTRSGTDSRAGQRGEHE